MIPPRGRNASLIFAECAEDIAITGEGKIDANGKPYTADDDWYAGVLNRQVDVGQAPSGMGRYQDLYDANPYRQLEYRQSGWQRLLGNLGFRTSYDDFIDQAKINAAEYDAGIASMKFQNEYNSPAAEADRMRAAGLNPDLQGIGDVAESASPTEDPNGMPVQDSSQQFSQVVQVTRTVMDIIPAVMSFATNLSQLKGVRLQNDLLENEVASKGVDLATKFFNEGLTEADYRDAFEKNDFTNLLSASKKNSDSLAKTLFSSRAARQKFQLSYGMHERSLLAEMQKYKTWDEFEKNRKSLLSQRASKFFSEDDEMMQGLLASFFNPLEEYQQKMNEINLRYARKVSDLNLPEDRAQLEDMQNANQRVYEGNIDPALQAGSENAVNAAQKQQQEIMEATNQLFADIMSGLKEKDNWWSKIAMALVGIARAQLLSGMSFQFGRSQHVDPYGNIQNLSSFSVSQ